MADKKPTKKKAAATPFLELRNKVDELRAGQKRASKKG